MKKVLALALFIIMSVSSTINVNAYYNENAWGHFDNSNNNWNKDKIMDCVYSIDMIWNEPVYGLDTPGNVNIPVSKILHKYGRDISSTSKAYDTVDFVARTIFSEAINVKPRIENAYAIAQVIRNRQQNTGKSLKYIVRSSQFNGTGSRPWLKPSADEYDPEGWSEDITQEELWIHCLYLAKALKLNYDIPTRQENGRKVYINVENSYHMYDIADSNPFYRYRNTNSQIDFSKYDDADEIIYAKYYYMNGEFHKIKKTPIKIGSHIYYTY